VPRVCTVCSHPKRAEIDRALLAGEPFRHIAARFDTSTAALQRHKAEHLSERMAQVAERNAEADVRTALDVVAQLKAINGASLSILKEARDRRDGELALKAIDRIQKQIELQAKLIDLINDGATINIIVSPEWVRLRTVILTALHPYPDAAQAVARRLQVIEGGQSHAAD
jgi:hypothetical protein